MRSYWCKGMLIFAAAVFMLASAQTGLAEKAGGSDKNAEDAGYVAVVDGVEISRQDLDRKLDMMKARYSSQGMPIKGERLAQLRETILDNLIEKQLLYQESQEVGIEVDSEKIQSEIDQLKGQFENEEAFEKKIASMNYSEETLSKEIRENMAIRALIDQEVASKVSVTDADVQSYYKENKQEFEVPEKVHARHILIEAGPDASGKEKARAEEKIREVQEKLEAGAEFSELARQHSEGPSSEKGGDLGSFSRGQMVENFDKAAFALAPGEVSDIVETRFGYHLIKVEDKTPSSMESLDEVKASIREKLQREKVMQELEPYIESLKQKYPVEKNLPEADQG
ncbi:MAG: peptidylprolyl isomerase [Desulfobacterales bacterium]|nr:peptidylprolyl isomerase [Desulfobacterales bacterium]